MADGPTALGPVDLAPVVWSSGILIAAVLDSGGVVLDASPAFERLAGRDPRKSAVGAFIGGGQGIAFIAWLGSADAEWRTTTWSAFPDADEIPIDFRCAVCRVPGGLLVLIGEPVVSDDVASKLIGINKTLITEHRRLDRERDRLDKVAQQDALTGLANRRAFDGRLGRPIDGAGLQSEFAVVMLDVDHFKGLNDDFGHPTGDAVLRWLGGLLRAAARKTDFVARYGGEEFVAILPAAGPDDAASWAERLRIAVRNGSPPGVDRPVTVSLGVAASRPTDIGGDVVARADRALYAAKRGGRDRVIVDGGSAQTAG
jgi:diguanylate cyclase (GGDEF)-like protein